MLEEWMKEVKQKTRPEDLGMVLVHRGLVRGTSKDGRTVQGMRLSYDDKKLQELLADHKSREGVADIKVWINEGHLKVGDDIMLVLVAGRFRSDVFPVFESLLSAIKKKVVHEQETA